MLRCASSPRLLAAITFFLPMMLPLSAIASAPPYIVTTWWPDPVSGLIWSGDPAGSAYSQVSAYAVQACAALQLDGYSGWRLPTEVELRGALTTVTDEAVYNAIVGKGERAHLEQKNFRQETGPGLKFVSVVAGDLWTGDSVDGIHYIAFRADRNQFVPMPYKEQIFTINKAAGYCVHAMSPALRTLAAVAHANSPVSSEDQLRDLATFWNMEHTISLADMPLAVDQALALGTRASAARNPIDAGRAYDDAAYLEVLEGRFADAIAEFAVAHQANKEDSLIKANKVWAKRVASDAKGDPQTTTMWIALYKSDIARRDGKLAEAEADANAAIAVEPGWAEGYGRLGEAYEAEGKAPQAIAAYQEGTSKNSHSAENLRAQFKSAQKSFASIQKQQRATHA